MRIKSIDCISAKSKSYFKQKESPRNYLELRVKARMDNKTKLLAAGAAFLISGVTALGVYYYNKRDGKSQDSARTEESKS